MTQQHDIFLWTLFKQLRQWQFALAPTDYKALYQALNVGFGWASQDALRDLCCTLWAKSRQQQEILGTLFDKLALDFGWTDWQLPKPITTPSPAKPHPPEPEIPLDDSVQTSEVIKKMPEISESNEFQPIVEGHKRFPEISFAGVELAKQPFLFTPQFMITQRETAQIWRRLRKPVREGAKTELDIEASIALRCQRGIVAPIVLVPRRKNVARLLLLVDRQGSMTPFHRICDIVCDAMQRYTRFGEVTTFYFHNVPAEGADESVLAPLSDQLFPKLDMVLSDIQALTTAYVYQDTKLLAGIPLTEVLPIYADKAAVVILSDGGAARGYYNTIRLLDTIASLKALRTYTSAIVWLNPLPPAQQPRGDYWANTTAAQIARHIPMFPLDRDGLYRAVNVLQGKTYSVECPL